METSLVRYRVDTHQECIRLSQVTEIIPMVALDPPPERAAEECLGILHYRGKLLPVFDIQQNQEAYSIDPGDYLMVMAEQEPAQAMRVSEVIEVFSVASNTIEQVAVGPKEVAELMQFESHSLQVRRDLWDVTLETDTTEEPISG
jgi:chemotaxis signal transduction protein